MSEREPAPEEPETFEASLEKLQGILAELEDGDLPLMESIEKYRQGIEAFQKCGLLLDQARKTVEILTEEALRSLERKSEDEARDDG